MTTRRRGFTLIELLVVIAIIGILAAMLFPVFARARESARKTQCLASVKNIAVAIQMYYTDYDQPWRNERDRRAIDYFNTKPGGRSGAPYTWPDICNRARQANPYLRDAVILEPYIKSVDIWKCPSAKVMSGATFIVPQGRDGYWLNAYIDNEGNWGTGTAIAGPCAPAFPSGWGGEVTDSFTQQRTAGNVGKEGSGGEAGVFVAGIGINDNMHWMNFTDVQDASRFITCGDTGRQAALGDATSLAWPDTCALNGCGSSSCGYSQCANADWDNCSWSRVCGLSREAADKFWSDPNYQKTFTRHMGGSNVGFFDGHAKWFLVQTILTQSPPFPDPYFESGPYPYCLAACWPGNGVIY